MDAMEFDERGNLRPYAIIETDLSTIKRFLVDPFIESQSRVRLFAQYQRYAHDLQALVQSSYVQWIDGSFITQKENPADIDLLTFIDFELINQHAVALNSFKGKEALQKYGMDTYIVVVYPEAHPQFFFTESDKRYWQHFFGFTRPDRRDPRYPKGILQINF